MQPQHPQPVRAVQAAVQPQNPMAPPVQVLARQPSWVHLHALMSQRAALAHAVSALSALPVTMSHAGSQARRTSRQAS